jgi:hypothetical protein
MKHLLKSLAAFQYECPTIKKTKSNDFGKYKYTDLSDVTEAIKPLLQKHGLAYFQTMDSNNVMKTTLFHVESAELLDSFITMPLDVELKGMNKYQVMGSAISYIRKYQLCSILGIVSDEKSIDSLEPQKPKEQTLDNKRFTDALKAINEGKITIEKLKEKFQLSEAQEKALLL